MEATTVKTIVVQPKAIVVTTRNSAVSRGSALKKVAPAARKRRTVHPVIIVVRRAFLVIKHPVTRLVVSGNVVIITMIVLRFTNAVLEVSVLTALVACVSKNVRKTQSATRVSTVAKKK